MTILASQIQHGTFFKRNGNVYAVHEEYEDYFRASACGDYISVIKGSRNKLADYFNRGYFVRVPLQILGAEMAEGKGWINGYIGGERFFLYVDSNTVDGNTIISIAGFRSDFPNQLTRLNEIEATTIFRYWNDPEIPIRADKIRVSPDNIHYYIFKF